MAFDCSVFSGNVAHRSMKQFPTLQTYGTDKRKRAALGPASRSPRQYNCTGSVHSNIEASVRSDSRSRRCTSYDSASGAPHATQTLGLRSSQQGSDTSSTACRAISLKSNYETLTSSVSREDATCDAATKTQKLTSRTRAQLDFMSRKL